MAYLSENRRLDYATGIYLLSFSRHCGRNGDRMSDGIIAEWSMRRESERYYTHRARCIIIRRLVRYIAAVKGVLFALPSYAPDPKYVRRTARSLRSDQPYRKSVVSGMAEAYQSHIYASGRLKRRTMERIRRFNEFCATEYPEATVLTGEIVDNFCLRGENESHKSRNNRVGAIREFIRFTNGRGLTDLALPETTPRASVTTYTPHPFTPEEIMKFFAATDSFTPSVSCRDIRARLLRLELPVFFRLLYSSGMRTTEVRLLCRNDIDLTDGVITIRRSKGLDEHRVTLHETMRLALVAYDRKMEDIMPGRRTFFPNENDGPYSREWVSDNFKKIWRRISGARARAYDLRSNYAVANINKWCGEQDLSDWDRRLLSLSRSMGHRHLHHTLYYYKLVPLFSERLEALTGRRFEELLPELDKYFENEENN